MSGAGERPSLPYEGKAPSSLTGKGPAPCMPPPAPPCPLPHEGSEEEWEEAKEEVEEEEEEEVEEEEEAVEYLQITAETLEDLDPIWQIWPSFCREAELPGSLLEWARRKKNWRLRCQDHKGWFLWHPPRPGGCLLCHRTRSTAWRGPLQNLVKCSSRTSRISPEIT